MVQRLRSLTTQAQYENPSEARVKEILNAADLLRAQLFSGETIFAGKLWLSATERQLGSSYELSLPWSRIKLTILR